MQWCHLVSGHRRLCRFWHATLRLCSAIHQHHPPQRSVLSKSAASGSIRWCCFRSCWTVLSHVMWGRPGCLLQSARGEANRILLASALSSMHIICPNRVSRRHCIIAVSLSCFVSLHTSSFWTNWYHLMPSSICRHHWSSASILRASVLYSFSFVEVVSRDFQIWFSRLCMAAWVMALQRLISQVLPVVEWIREPR